MANTELAYLEHFDELDREGAFSEDGGELSEADYADSRKRATEPPEDPVAHSQECEDMGRE